MDGNVEKALEFERSKENAKAAALFERLGHAQHRPDLLNQAAINWRLAGNYPKAHKAFDMAYQHALGAGDISLVDRVRRDQAMLLVEQSASSDALPMLRASRKSQIERADDLEAAVTLGFLGRAELTEGLVVAAQQHLLRADFELHRRHDVYELNNLIWLLKALPWHSRLDFARRAMVLARRTGYKRRAAEAVILLIGGNKLYDRLRRR